MNRVALNVIVLWTRFGVRTIAVLLTTRFALQALGISAFGVYIAVASLLFMCSFANGAMQIVSQRSLTMNLGQNAETRRLIFNSCLRRHLVVALVFLLIGSTIGVWIFSTALSIPEVLRDQAWIVFQLIVAATVIGAVLAPFEALGQAYERFEIFAAAEIVSSIAILLGTYWLLEYNGDRFLAYGFIQASMSIVGAIAASLAIALIYPEARIRLADFAKRPDIGPTWPLFSWMMVGSLSTAARVHGFAVLANAFFGPVASAVLGVASQVTNALGLAANAIVSATAPRILKARSDGQSTNSISIALVSAKYASFFTALVSAPLLIAPHDFLSIWLTQLPEGTDVVLGLLIAALLLDQLSASSGTAHLASGRVARYQITCGLLTLAALPASAAIAVAGGPLTGMLVTLPIAAALVSFARVRLLEDESAGLVRRWISKSVVPSGLVLAAGLVGGTIVAQLFPPGVFRIIIVGSATSVTILILAWSIGLDRVERDRIFDLVQSWRRN